MLELVICILKTNKSNYGRWKNRVLGQRSKVNQSYTTALQKTDVMSNKFFL